jgi:glycolate oxidase
VVNLDLTRALDPTPALRARPVEPAVLHDRRQRRQQLRGPHCLAYGVTSAHVVAVEVVLPDGEVAMLGGLDPSPRLDLRGAFVGGEGTLGIATRIAVRLTPDPPAVQDPPAATSPRSTARRRP